jgi:hypothetical protein
MTRMWGFVGAAAVGFLTAAIGAFVGRGAR